MEPYVPSQGSAKRLNYLDWDLAETSTWVKSVQREHLSYLLWQGGLQPMTVSGRGEWSGASLQSCVKHQIKCKLKVECSMGCPAGLLWTTGLQGLGTAVWPTARRRWATFFDKDFFR